MRTSRKTDFRSRDIAKNNFSGIDISQGLDLDPPSLSPYFLLIHGPINIMQFFFMLEVSLCLNSSTDSQQYYRILLS